MHAFEVVDLEALAQREGTPLYVYSAPAIRGRVQGLQAALQGLDALVCFAVKANSSQAVLQLMDELGAGADIVSGGELWRSLRAGIPPERIVFRSEEHTSELQSLMRISYAVFCLKKKNKHNTAKTNRAKTK